MSTLLVSPRQEQHGSNFHYPGVFAVSATALLNSAKVAFFRLRAKLLLLSSASEDGFQKVLLPCHFDAVNVHGKKGSLLPLNKTNIPRQVPSHICFQARPSRTVSLRAIQPGGVRTNSFQEEQQDLECFAKLFAIGVVEIESRKRSLPILYVLTMLERPPS